MTKVPAEVTIGNHIIRVDGDSAEVTIRGLITYDDMYGWLEQFKRIKRAHGQLFTLYDGRESRGIEPRARKYAAVSKHDDADADLRVAFGFSFASRVMLTMVIRAHELVARRVVNVHLTDGEKEARATFEAERDKLRAAIVSTKSL